MSSSPPPLIVVSGFGAFEQVASNPSGLAALALEANPPPATRVVAVELPVSFERAPPALDAFLESCAPCEPSLLVALGVRKKPGYQVELVARSALERSTRPDVDGVVAAEADMPRNEPDLQCSLGASLAAAVASRDGWALSRDAGGYVCERIYHRLLEQGLRYGCPAVFIHVPPERFTPVGAQVVALRSFVGELARVD